MCLDSFVTTPQVDLYEVKPSTSEDGMVEPLNSKEQEEQNENILKTDKSGMDKTDLSFEFCVCKIFIKCFKYY